LWSGVGGAAAVLELIEVSKAFGSTQALDRVSFQVVPGRVHGLVGQNGSGKSTVVKILSGYHTPDPGSIIVVRGRAVTRALSGGGSRALGLRFVHQDLGVIPELSVTENLYVDRFSTESQYVVRWRQEHARAAALLSSFGVDVDPSRRMGDLSAALQAMVVIVRAAEGLRTTAMAPKGTSDASRRTAGADASGARTDGVPCSNDGGFGDVGNSGSPAQTSGGGVLVLDEATASLPFAARTQLRAVVQEVVNKGHGVLFVSHFPEEVLDWADQVTVLRDGRVVADRPTAGMDEDELVELIIGRKLTVGSSTGGGSGHDSAGDSQILEVTNLRTKEIRELSFSVRRGEVLGITGLVGSGHDQVCKVLGGVAHAETGTLVLDGRRMALPNMSPVLARRAGIAFVPQDRQRQGGAVSLTVAENISLAILDRHRGHLDRLRHRQLRREVRELLLEYGVQPPLPDADLRSLSGGNQQKVVIAKAMAQRPRVLALVEPTQGVDVGARADIIGKLQDVARSGTVVICATTDASQLEQLCDRVLVLRRGVVGAELSGSALTEDRIVEETYRGSA
jgi:ribose transport system ATP-binding protein